MQKIELTKHDFIFLGILSVFASFFTVVWMAITGNMPQVYNDIVIEWTALVRGNKGAEILLLRLLLVLCAVACFFYCKFFSKNTSGLVINEKGKDASFHFVAWLCSIVVLKLIFWGNVQGFLLLALCFAVIAYQLDKKTVVTTLLLFFLSYYACFAIYHLLNFLGGYNVIKFFTIMKTYSQMTAMLFASFCVMFSLLFAKRVFLQKRAILTIQFVIPCLYLILTIKKYKFQDYFYEIGIPLQSKALIIFAIVLSTADVLRINIKNSKRSDFSVNDIISIGTCIAIMCFNFYNKFYNGQGVIVNDDWHHPFENIFAFQQVFELGQIPYKDFIPPSGLYSIVHGAVFKFFGNGNVAYMHLCDNIYFYLIIAITLFLLQFHLNKAWCLWLALFLQFPYYNRVVFMAITVLLLLHPKLVERYNLWLKVFLLMSVFHGLYYPVYGVACFIGFLPMFIVQVRKVICNVSLYRSVRFWMGWIPVFVILFASTPFLWGALIHMKAMSGQSILSDGISIFGQELPSSFMSYLKDFFRYAFYNSMRVVPLVLVVLIPFLFFIKLVKINGHSYVFSRQCFVQHIELFTMIFSLMFMPLVSYIYTFIRCDVFTFFARSWSALVSVLILYVIFVLKYVKGNHFQVIALLLVNFIIVPSWGIGVECSDWKMFSFFEVPQNFRFVQHGEFGHDTIGNCFLADKFYNKLESSKTVLNEINGDVSFGKLGNFGLYYIFEQKGDSELFIMKSYAAAEETKNMLMSKKGIVGYLDPRTCYYLYKWLACSGDYVWDSGRKSFVLNNHILCGDELKAQNNKNSFCRENIDLENDADVFGLSFKSLKRNFSENKILHQAKAISKKLRIDFTDYVNGSNADFVYINFAGIKNEYVTTLFDGKKEQQVQFGKMVSSFFAKQKPNPDMQVFVRYDDDNGVEHCVKANYGNGKLLLNLGVGSKWLLSQHNHIDVEVYKNGLQIDVPCIEDIKFLKLRQIYKDKTL